jgi:hypothetical protein
MKKVLLLLLLVASPAFADKVKVDDEVCTLLGKQVELQAKYMSLSGTSTIDYMNLLDIMSEHSRVNGHKPDYLAALMAKTFALKINGYINDKEPVSKIKRFIGTVCEELKGREYDFEFGKG